MNFFTLTLPLFALLLLGLSFFVIYKIRLMLLFFKYKNRPVVPAERFKEWPVVTLQLPIFNEINVVERVLASAVAVDYPKDKLEIQILDDSTDETLNLTRALAEKYAAEGFRISHFHRTDRTDFKAGALAHGLKTAAGDFIAVFDSDFLIPKDFIQRTVNFFTDPGIGMVQCRWGFLNGADSLITRLQAAYLNGHFMIEHSARFNAGYFFNFNGTAGIWRKRAILESGGWQGDTLTEDLDLSYRAQLNDWRFVYLNDCVAYSELPPNLHAFNGQQFRWVKGMCQVLRKILPRIWRSEASLRHKLDVTCHLTSGAAYPMSIFISLLAFPLLYTAHSQGALIVFNLLMGLLGVNSLVIFLYYFTAQREVYGLGRRAFIDPIMLLLFSMGLAVNGSYAVLEALLGKRSPFIRTPKFNKQLHRKIRVERGITQPHRFSAFFAAYFSLLLMGILWTGRFKFLPLFFFFSTGYYWVLFTLTREKRVEA